jgi:hypothetical protein
LPIGEYDHDQQLNIGQNRWCGRIGLPIVWQLGDWVPGRRTTLEFLPAVWLFGNNDDYVGQDLETDPSYQIDAHLTRDLTEHFWASLDGTLYQGGKSSINDDAPDDLRMDSFTISLVYGWHPLIEGTKRLSRE